MNKNNRIKISILYLLLFILLNSCEYKIDNRCQDDIYEVNDIVYISPYKSSKVYKGYIMNITQEGYLINYKNEYGEINAEYYHCYSLNKFD